MRLLAMREQSRLELRRKLRQKGAAPELIDSVLDELMERGWQSDERFCESFVRHKIAAGWGAQKIRAELSARGIDSSLQGEALANAEVDWSEGALNAARKKYRAGTELDARQKQKIARHLQARGYSVSEVIQALSQLEREARDTPH